jgi:5-methyltetrahydrofolate--homocysteine methyltransferase
VVAGDIFADVAESPDFDLRPEFLTALAQELEGQGCLTKASGRKAVIPDKNAKKNAIDSNTFPAISLRMAGLALLRGPVPQEYRGGSMAAKGSYIVVGENIHCTRIRMTSGKFVEIDASGKSWLLFKDRGQAAKLPIPAAFTDSDDWQAGKIRHVAAAIWQGLRGDAAAREAGERYVAAMALEQEAGGAWFLDVNVDEFSMDLAEKIDAMNWAARVIQKHSALPLSIDSSDSRILEAGLAACYKSKGRPMVNSVSLERAAMIPIAAKAGAAVIAGATGAERMPESVEERLTNTRELLKRLAEAGIALGDTYIDPLVMPVSVDTGNPGRFMEAVRALRAEHGKAVHFAPGLSNVSFGLPKRPVINQVFAKLCLEAGCDGGIVDPAQINDRTLGALDLTSGVSALAKELLLGNDEYGMNWIGASRE